MGPAFHPAFFMVIADRWKDRTRKLYVQPWACGGRLRSKLQKRGVREYPGLLFPVDVRGKDQQQPPQPNRMMIMRRIQIQLALEPPNPRPLPPQHPHPHPQLQLLQTGTHPHPQLQLFIMID